MLKSSGFLETIKTRLQVPVEEVPFIVRAVLGHQGWGNFYFDLHDRMGSVTADRKKQLRKAGLSRMFDHHVEVKWKSDDTGVYLRVEVQDHDGFAQTPDLKDECAELLKAIFSRAEEVKAAGPKAKKTSHGTAKWGEPADMEANGFVSTETDSTRFVLGLSEKDEQLQLPRDSTYKHVIVSGPTGTGKTSRMLIPNLLKRFEASAVVTEATSGDEPPDLYQKTAGFRKSKGSAIYYFNPDDLTSDRINPIDQIHTIEDALELVNLIFENTNKKEGGGGDQIWENSERQLFTALMLHAKGEKACLADVRAWITGGVDGLKRLIMTSRIDKARSEFMAFYNSGTENFRNGVLVGAMMRLNIWISPKISALTETTDVDVEGLEKGLFTYYLAVPSSKDYMKPVAALIFSYILNRAENRKFEKPLFLCLDEFTNFGRIPGFPQKMSIIRHRDLGAILGFQSYNQLEEVYGRLGAANIWANTITKVFFKPNDLDFARKISDMLGKETVYKRTMSSSGQVQEQEFGKPLMDPGEVLAFPKQFALCFNESTSPLKLGTYNWQQFETETCIKPPQKPVVKVDQRLEKTCEISKQTPEWQKDWLETNPTKELNYLNENIRDMSEEALKKELASKSKQVEPLTPKPAFEVNEPTSTPDKAVVEVKEVTVMPDTPESFTPKEAVPELLPESDDSFDPGEPPEENDEFGGGAVI